MVVCLKVSRSGAAFWLFFPACLGFSLQRSGRSLSRPFLWSWIIYPNQMFFSKKARFHSYEISFKSWKFVKKQLNETCFDFLLGISTHNSFRPSGFRFRHSVSKENKYVSRLLNSIILITESRVISNIADKISKHFTQVKAYKLQHYFPKSQHALARQRVTHNWLYSCVSFIKL